MSNKNVERFFERLDPDSRERWRCTYIEAIRKIENKERRASPAYMLPHFKEGLSILDEVIRSSTNE